MAYLIDDTYFIKELRIPNMNQTQIAGAVDNFDQWIDKEARLLLQRALGFTLFNELDGFIDGDGNLMPSAPQQWQNLVNGETYTYQGEELRWKGLIFTEGTFKGSVIAYYVYCKWLEFQLSNQSGFGDVRGQAVNSIPQNSTHRYVTTWNTFIEMYQENLFGGGFYFYRQQFPAISHKRHIRFVDYADYQDRTYVSLLEYLTHQEDQFPETDRYVYEYQNTLGI